MIKVEGPILDAGNLFGLKQKITDRIKVVQIFFEPLNMLQVFFIFENKMQQTGQTFFLSISKLEKAKSS